MNKEFYQNKRIFITGGAGFIGSHLLDKLIELGAETTVGDNLSTGSVDNILRVWERNNLKYKKTLGGYQTDRGHKFMRVNFMEFKDTAAVLRGHEIVFHLAATIGGRGFIEAHPADCCRNFSINQNVISASSLVGVERLQITSSACVYPVSLQNKYGSNYLLKEEDAFKEGWGNADEEYGWAKLMGEMAFKAYHKQYGLKGSITRYVTVYGPWENDTHAIIALIKRAVEKQDPYIIWGSGKQDRDFTYVADIVSGTLDACRYLDRAEVVNLGNGVRHTIREVAELIFDILSWRPKKIRFDKSKPEGVKTRSLDIQNSEKLLGWRPRYDLRKGLEETIAWFMKECPEAVESLN